MVMARREFDVGSQCDRLVGRLCQALVDHRPDQGALHGSAAVLPQQRGTCVQEGPLPHSGTTSRATATPVQWGWVPTRRRAASRLAASRSTDCADDGECLFGAFEGWLPVGAHHGGALGLDAFGEQIDASRGHSGLSGQQSFEMTHATPPVASS